MTNQSDFLSSENEMIAFGETLGQTLSKTDVVFLLGNLGAGKTTLTRGILYGLGYSGPVPSPTYTLVEPYEIGGQQVYHMDLYRLKHSDELEMLGVRDFIGSNLCLIEWPERANEVLPNPDVTISIEPSKHGRVVKVTRC